MTETAYPAHQLTLVRFELAADDMSYGDMLDALLCSDVRVIHADLDLRTPSSQSSPTVSLVMPADQLDAFGRLCGFADFADWHADQLGCDTVAPASHYGYA